MQHLYSLSECHLDASIVTIGSFDGVHLGHQTIIKKLVQEAHENGLPAVVVTFYPHPAVVLRNINKPFYLTSPEERASLLGKLGIDYVITLTFNMQMASLSAREFIDLLTEHLHIKRLIVGQNFSLGKDRQGNVNQLAEIGKRFSYIMEVIPLVKELGEKISSSQIRALLLQGEVRKAARILGRNYSLKGKVIHGDGRGKRLGIPTANLNIWSHQLIPAWGIYATWAYLGTQKYLSATNIGIRPTFQTNDPTPLIEVHILEFDKDIYNQELTLEFVEFLRPELRFDTIQSLVGQMQQDITKAYKVLSHA